MRIKVIILFSCTLALWGCSSTQVPVGITAKVQRVVTGQSIEVVDTSQQQALIEKIRLIGIESPDLQQQPWGWEARDQLAELLGELQGEQWVLGEVLLEFDAQEKDNFGRRLAYVWHDELLINEQLVKTGAVLAKPRSPNNKYQERLQRAQESARIMGYGIWNPEKPLRQTPEEFRQRK